MEKRENILDTQILISNYLEIKDFNFYSPFYQNPLTNLYYTRKDQINLPNEKYFPENCVCNKMVSDIPNMIDRKKINCLKVFNYSKKIVYGTANGNLISYDISQNMFYKYTPNQSTSISSLEFGKNENYLLVGDNSGRIIYFLNTDSGFQQKYESKGHNAREAVTDISFSPTDLKYF